MKTLVVTSLLVVSACSGTLSVSPTPVTLRARVEQKADGGQRLPCESPVDCYMEATRKLNEATKRINESVERIGTLQLIPTGTVLAFYGPKVPEGYLLCDGKTHPALSFPRLHGFLTGRVAREGDTFAVPNLQGMFLRGLDPDAKVDPDGRSRVIGSVQGSAAVLAPHKHEMDHLIFLFNRQVAEFKGALAGGEVFGDGGTKGLSRGTGETSLPKAGAPTASETRPTNVAVLFLIKD